MTGIKKIFEAIVLRAIPGLINLFTLLLLSNRLSIIDYGQYSTIIASSGFLAAMIYGPLTFSIISQHTQIAKNKLDKLYESSLVSTSIIISLCILMLSLYIPKNDYFDIYFIISCITFGFYTIAQEILHAQLKIIQFGISSLTQSLLFIITVLIFTDINHTTNFVLILYSISYLIAASVSLHFSNNLYLKIPKFTILTKTFEIGFPYTISIALEQCIYLGTRFIIHFFGANAYLGTFSFCTDIAQRIIGFLINATTFVTVPTAFKEDTIASNLKFKTILCKGAILATLLASTAFLIIIFLWNSRLIEQFNKSLFDPISFTILSLAVLINRIKKLTIDPIIMRENKTSMIAFGYAASGPLTLIFCTIFIYLQLPRWCEIAYTAGYLIAATSTIIIYKRFTTHKVD